jgi:hypothetical protein
MDLLLHVNYTDLRTIYLCTKSQPKTLCSEFRWDTEEGNQKLSMKASFGCNKPKMALEDHLKIYISKSSSSHLNF